MRSVSTRSVRNPGSSSRIRPKLLMSRPAPIRSTNATPISPTTRRSRARPRARPGVPRVPSRSASFRSGREESRAGRTPNRRPVRTDTPSVNRSTRASTTIGRKRGTSAGMESCRRSTPHSASRAPKTPPARDSMTLSVRSCRRRRARPAPNEARIAISFCRAAARDSSRLATLAQAMSRTKATAPRRISRAVRTSPTISSWSGMRVIPMPVFASG